MAKKTASVGHDVLVLTQTEAWMHGLPVICLPLGGCGEMVDEACGCVVSVTGRSEEECVAALGSEIGELAKNECRRQQLVRGALARSRTYTWSRVAASNYAEIEQCFARDAAAGSQAPVSRQVVMEARPCAD
jgi:glycosyltransferase involved in cell wall biosynthesis